MSVSVMRVCTTLPIFSDWSHKCEARDAPGSCFTAVIPNKIVERICTAIGIHILLPTATDTPCDEPGKLLCFKQIIDQCPLYVGCADATQERRAQFTKKDAFQTFLTQLYNKERLITMDSIVMVAILCVLKLRFGVNVSKMLKFCRITLTSPSCDWTLSVT